MISFPFVDAEIEYKQSDCYFLHIHAAHFNSTKKQENKWEIINIKHEKKLGGLGLFIYSFDNCTLKVRGRTPYIVSEIKLNEGTNHVAIPYGGIDLIDLNGVEECKIKSIRHLNSSSRKTHKWEFGFKTIIHYVYNITNKKWERIKNYDSFYLPHGISVFIDAGEECELRLKKVSKTTTTTTTTLPGKTTTTTIPGS